MTSFRIVHISDTHFGTILPKVKQSLTKALHDFKPDLIILSGDITQRARVSQFKAAKDFCKSLKPISILAVPGNHDIPLFNIFARFLHPYFSFKTFFMKKVEQDYTNQSIQIIGLNSTSRWRHVQGFLNIKRIKKRLARFNQKSNFRIVVFHHPVDCLKNQDEKNLLINRQHVMQLLQKYNVDLILNGHVHDPHIALSKIRYPLYERSLIIEVAGTATSWRTRSNAPNSFYGLEINSSQNPDLKITRYNMNEDFQFELGETKNFCRNNNNWKKI